jgi:hypothetical protein
MKLSSRLFREKTQAVTLQTITFNASGTYYPPYGKTSFLLQGQGQPGNATTGGTYANTNPGSGGNANYNPYVAGNANYNPVVAGNANYNPVVAGNANYNPVVPGNYAGVNGGVNQSYIDNAVPGSYTSSTTYGSAANCPSSYSTSSGNQYYSATYFCTPYYNPSTGGNYANTNPPTGGNYANTNASTGGNYANTNAGSGGNVAGYNTYYPGNANYNTVVPGNSGSPSSVLGVSLPGGAADTAAPIIGYVPVSIDYTTSGISITCPPGGYVKIQNL